jgi:hypothetical protein
MVIDMGDWFRRFMQGRYGVDHFSHFLVILAFLLMFVQLFIRQDVVDLILSILVVFVLVFSYYRTFSRNHYRRYQENEWYLQYHNKVKYFFSREKDKMSQRKTHRIFRCPNCGQSVRVPKGKGKIAITCPMCRTEFIKRS